MRNFVCVMWLILFPVAQKLANYLEFLANGPIQRTNSDSSRIIENFVLGLIWALVGYFLYERKKDISSDNGTGNEN